MIVTREEIEAAKTPAGGFTKETLAGWGIEWPPESGWKEKLMAGGVFEPYVPEPVNGEDQAWAEELCRQHGDDPERIVGQPPLPLWRSYLTYARHAKNTAAVISAL